MLDVQLLAIVCVGYNANENVYCLYYRKGHEMYGPVCMFNKMKQQYNKTVPHVNIVNG